MTITHWIIICAVLAAIIAIIIIVAVRHKSKKNNMESPDNNLPQIQNDETGINEETDMIYEQDKLNIQNVEMENNSDEQFISTSETDNTQQSTSVHGEPLNIAEIIEENLDDSVAEDVRDFTDPSQTYNLGRSGRVYTKEELDLLIKE